MDRLTVVIIGLEEWAQRAAEYLLERDAVIYGFLSDKETYEVQEILDIPVLGHFEDKAYRDLWKRDEVQYFVGVKDVERRMQVTQKLFGFCNKHPISVIHPTSYVARSASLANGIMIGPFCSIGEGVVIQADTFLGSHVSIGAYTQIDRGCDIQAGVVIGSNVTIEKRVLVGMNATIFHGIRLEEGSVVMAGSVVLQSVPKGVAVMGNPAQKVQ